MASFKCGRATAVAILVLLNLALTNGDFLEILPPGEIQSKPSGNRLMLTCKPRFDNLNLVTNIQWLDQMSRPIESRSTYQSKSGATTPGMYTELHQDASLSLVFNPLKEGQAGRYTCVANYANNELFNNSVVVETIDAIKWLDAPEYQSLTLGQDKEIRCQVSARPAPSVDWLKDSSLVITDDHYIIETHALKIKNVAMEDEGVYTCRAAVYQTGEYAERVIRVEVYEEPKIEDLPSEIEIVEGKVETITCKARGKPSPKFSWVRSLTKENLANADRFSVNAERGMLTITNVNRHDAGEYQCIAENAAGVANTNIVVNVMSKPKIMEFLNRTMPEKKQVEITCRAFGRPPPEVIFRKHTAQKAFVKGMQPGDDRIILNTIQDNQKGETIASLTIQNVLRKDDGLYECIATNKIASAYKNGHLTVEFPPSFASMENQTVWSWEQRPVNLTCIAESIPNATIRWMLNDQDIEKSPTKNTFKIIGNGPFSTLTVTPYDKRFYGNYKCLASNVHGNNERIIELREAGRPGAIEQARMAEVTATTIAFTIVPPATEPELPIEAIVVQYKEEFQNWAQAKNRTWSLNSPYVLENLKPETNYEFRFLARNQVGDGNWGRNLAEKTPQRAKPAAPKMKMRKDNSNYDESMFANQYDVAWIAPPDNGEPIDQYDIRWCEMVRQSGEFEVQEATCKNVIIKGAVTKHWLRDLKANQFYRADARAHNAIGYGEPGFVQFKTAPESSGSTADYSFVSGGGDTFNPSLGAIVTTIALISLVI